MDIKKWKNPGEFSIQLQLCPQTMCHHKHDKEQNNEGLATHWGLVA